MSRVAGLPARPEKPPWVLPRTPFCWGLMGGDPWVGGPVRTTSAQLAGAYSVWRVVARGSKVVLDPLMTVVVVRVDEVFTDILCWYKLN